MSEYPRYKLLRHRVEVGRMMVEGWDDREDGCARIGCERHISQMHLVERGFTHAEHQWASLFRADIGCALDEGLCQSIGYGCQRAHAAGQNDHSMRRIAAAGNG